MVCEAKPKSFKTLKMPYVNCYAIQTDRQTDRVLFVHLLHFSQVISFIKYGSFNLREHQSNGSLS